MGPTPLGSCSHTHWGATPQETVLAEERNTLAHAHAHVYNGRKRMNKKNKLGKKTREKRGINHWNLKHEEREREKKRERERETKTKTKTKTKTMTRKKTKTKTKT